MLIGPLDKVADYRLRLFIQGSAFATTLTSNTPALATPMPWGNPHGAQCEDNQRCHSFKLT